MTALPARTSTGGTCLCWARSARSSEGLSKEQKRALDADSGSPDHHAPVMTRDDIQEHASRQVDDPLKQGELRGDG